MHLLDWLKDGLLSDRARFRHSSRTHPQRAAWEEFADPSGRHDFGRRAHHPDPNGRYGFGVSASHRATRPRAP